MSKKTTKQKKEKVVAGHKAEFLALGYDEALAADTAQALEDGDTAKVFANQKKFLESHDKAYKAKLMGGNSTPPAGAGTDAMTLEALRKMSQQERLNFSVEHPDEYKKLYGGNT